MLDPENVQYLIAPATRAALSIDTLMYVFNFVDSAGFALVATDRELEPLLAVTEFGSYTPGEPIENPGFEFYMECVGNYLSEKGTARVGPIGGPITSPSKIVTREITNTVGPFLTVRWGQRSPYNLYCFKDGQQCLAGCVATAIAQIISFYSYPNSISLSYPGADALTQSLNWQGIKSHVKTPSYGSCPSVCQEHVAIGRFFREIGKQVNMDYGPNESGAYDSFVARCFVHFGYATGALSSYAYGSVCAQLEEDRLIYMSGGRTDTQGARRYHAWVVDGYKTITYEMETWNAPTSAGPWTYESTKYRYSHYVHCNWGWDGDSNGYFGSAAFNTANPVSIDTGCTNNTNDRNYNLDLKTIVVRSRN